MQRQQQPRPPPALDLDSGRISRLAASPAALMVEYGRDTIDHFHPGLLVVLLGLVVASGHTENAVKDQHHTYDGQ